MPLQQVQRPPNSHIGYKDCRGLCNRNYEIHGGCCNLQTPQVIEIEVDVCRHVHIYVAGNQNQTSYKS